MKTKRRPATPPSAESPRASRTHWLPPTAVLALGLVLRLVYLGELRQQPDFSKPYIDAAYHDVLARGIAFDDWTLPQEVNDPHFQTTPYFRGPGYPFFLALVYACSGGSYLAPRLVQILLGLLNALLLAHLAASLFGTRAAGIALFLMVSYWGFIYFEGELLAPTPLITLLLTLLTLCQRLQFQPSLPLAACAGFLLGCTGLFVSNVLLLAPLLLAWVALALPRSRRLPGLLLFATAMTSAILPVTLHNLRASGELVLISANAGINLYIGNNDKADGYSAVIPDLEEMTGLEGWNSFDWHLIVQKLALRNGSPLSHKEASQLFSAKARAWISTNPWSFFHLCFRRLALMLGPAEPHNNKMLELEREHSRILPWLPRFGLMAALGFTGILLWWLDHRRLRILDPGVRFTWLLLALAGLFAASYLPFFVTGRFRMPLVPFLILFAARTVDWLFDLLGKKAKASPLQLLAMGAALILFHMEFVSYRPDRAYWHFLRGSRFEAQGQDRQAVAELEKAIHLNTNQYEAMSRLGILRFKSGAAMSARQLWQRSLAIKPRQAQILNNLAWVLAEDPSSGPEEWQTALAHAELAVEITRRTEPGYLDTLAVVLERSGQREQARTVLNEALHVALQMDNSALVEELKTRLAAWQEP